MWYTAFKIPKRKLSPQSNTYRTGADPPPRPSPSPTTRLLPVHWKENTKQCCTEYIYKQRTLYRRDETPFKKLWHLKPSVNVLGIGVYLMAWVRRLNITREVFLDITREVLTYITKGDVIWYNQGGIPLYNQVGVPWYNRESVRWYKVSKIPI